MESTSDVDLEKQKKTSSKFVYTPEERRVLRKINFATVPFVCVVLYIQVYIYYWFLEGIMHVQKSKSMVWPYVVYRQVNAQLFGGAWFI